VKKPNKISKLVGFFSLVLILTSIALVALYAVHSGMFLYALAWILAWPVLVFDIESLMPRLMIIFVMQLINAGVLYLIYRLIFRASLRKSAIK
jgi:hypothetical protein